MWGGAQEGRRGGSRGIRYLLLSKSAGKFKNFHRRRSRILWQFAQFLCAKTDSKHLSLTDRFVIADDDLLVIGFMATVKYVFPLTLPVIASPRWTHYDSMDPLWTHVDSKSNESAWIHVAPPWTHHGSIVDPRGSTAVLLMVSCLWMLCDDG